MTEKRIVWKKADGAIAVTVPAPKGQRSDETEQQWLDRVAAKVFVGDAELSERLPDALASVLPGRRFRDCWRANDAGEIHIDLPLAREQRMAEIRVERNRLLDTSDKEWARLMDVGDAEAQAALKTYRQALRDIPQNTSVNRIKIPEALAAYEPDWPAHTAL